MSGFIVILEFKLNLKNNIMAKKKAELAAEKKIDIKDIVVNGVYKTYVNDIVKILRINKEREEFVLYNVTGSHRQWTSFKHIYLVERLY